MKRYTPLFKISEEKMKRHKQLFKEEKKEIKEEVDVKNIIDEVIDTDWSKDNESQMKILQLMKGIATSDEAVANKFMKKIDDFTSSLNKDEFKEANL